MPSVAAQPPIHLQYRIVLRQSRTSASMFYRKRKSMNGTSFFYAFWCWEPSAVSFPRLLSCFGSTSCICGERGTRAKEIQDPFLCLTRTWKYSEFLFVQVFFTESFLSLSECAFAEHFGRLVKRVIFGTSISTLSLYLELLFERFT